MIDTGNMSDVINARASDPDTSHLAGEMIEATGTAGTQRQIVLRAVQSVAGLTSAEIAACLGLDRYTPSRRLPELRRAGLVCNGESRKCNKTGKQSMTWFITEEGQPRLFD